MIGERTRRALAAALGIAMAASAAGCGGAAMAPKAAARMETENGYTGGDAAQAPPPGAVAMAPPAPPPPPGGGAKPVAAKAVSDAPHSAAMLIYTANLAMAVYQVTPGMDAVERVARDAGGYLSVRGDNVVTIRVPRDRFEEALGRIEKLGDVTHRDIKAEDVTDQYVDLEARLKNAYAVRDRLKELLDKAVVKEALDIERELGRITEQIEVMEGKLKLLRDQIAFSTITVQFSPMAEQTVHDTSLLAPFPWLQDIGLQSLLNVHQ
jgi:hypothetical protein